MSRFKDNLHRYATAFFLLILVAYGVYAAIFIWKTSFFYQGERFFILFDDATISMQYARNLANGAGPVWNDGGEPVEGYTNPLWVGVMALTHLTSLPDRLMALPIQILGAILFMLSLVFVRKIARFLAHGNEWAGLIAVGMTAFYYPFSNWSLLGTEVSILLLMITAAAWMAICNHNKGVFSPWVYLLLGISTWVRFDMGVPYVVIWVFLLWFDRQHRRQHLIFGGAALLFFLLSQTILRVVYYGDWLPNTYYLKMEGISLWLRLERGLYVFAKFAWNLGPVFLLLTPLLLLFRRDRYVLLLAALLIAQVAYSVYVGGDAWEHRGGANRFIALGMPFFLILFTESIRCLFELIKQRALLTFDNARWVTGVVNGGFIVFLALSLVNFNTLLDGNSLRYWLLLQRSIFAPGSERYAIDGLFLKDLTSENARLLVGAAGNVTYFSRRFTYDMMGKADKIIAHEPIRIPSNLESLTFLQPGHLKWDYAYSIGQLQPDVVVELKQYTDDEAAPYLVNYEKVKINGHNMYFKLGSTNIRWDLVRSGAYASQPVATNSEDDSIP